MKWDNNKNLKDPEKVKMLAVHCIDFVKNMNDIQNKI